MRHRLAGPADHVRLLVQTYIGITDREGRGSGMPTVLASTVVRGGRISNLLSTDGEWLLPNVVLLDEDEDADFGDEDDFEDDDDLDEDLDEEELDEEDLEDEDLDEEDLEDEEFEDDDLDEEDEFDDDDDEDEDDFDDEEDEF